MTVTKIVNIIKLLSTVTNRWWKDLYSLGKATSQSYSLSSNSNQPIIISKLVGYLEILRLDNKNCLAKVSISPTVCHQTLIEQKPYQIKIVKGILKLIDALINRWRTNLCSLIPRRILKKFVAV